ncbi:uncharacterized protein LOC112568098 [Pomacea canaliculata]|uniref:uncharacterized protein LOC112568098 n=1 Tax=Pomacea canaliculata TaxID=400727 RepID=UPI000D73F7B5|nr:uncharacterized protein LOC112568098 [Pomacea canaliculata]
MNAHPPPKLLGVVYNGSANNFISSKSEYENSVRSTCSSDTSYSSMITCTVTLLNQTIYTPGLYTVTFRNGLGDISFAFEIREKLLPTTNAMETTGQSKSEVAGPVAGGVICALVVIALVVSAVIFIRRKRRKPDERGLPRNQALTSKTYPERSLEIYDHLQRENINSPSVYQALGPQQASSAFTDHEDQENPHVYDIPIDLHENTRGTQQKETVYQNSIFS